MELTGFSHFWNIYFFNNEQKKQVRHSTSHKQSYERQLTHSTFDRIVIQHMWTMFDWARSFSPSRFQSQAWLKIDLLFSASPLTVWIVLDLNPINTWLDDFSDKKSICIRDWNKFDCMLFLVFQMTFLRLFFFFLIILSAFILVMLILDFWNDNILIAHVFSTHSGLPNSLCWAFELKTSWCHQVVYWDTGKNRNIVTELTNS